MSSGLKRLSLPDGTLIITSHMQPEAFAFCEKQKVDKLAQDLTITGGEEDSTPCYVPVNAFIVFPDSPSNRYIRRNLPHEIDNVKPELVDKKIMEEAISIINRGNDGGKYDDKGNSSHYQDNFIEYIREQELKYGTIIAYFICLSQVDRYNQRAGLKEGVPAEKDITKKMWYHKVSKHFAQKIKRAKEGIMDTPGQNKFVGMPEEVYETFASFFNKTCKKSIKLSEIVNDK